MGRVATVRSGGRTMKCRDCKYMESVGTNSLYVCTNENSENFGEYTGICCEDECEDVEE